MFELCSAAVVREDRCAAWRSRATRRLGHRVTHLHLLAQRPRSRLRRAHGEGPLRGTKASCRKCPTLAHTHTHAAQGAGQVPAGASATRSREGKNVCHSLPTWQASQESKAPRRAPACAWTRWCWPPAAMTMLCTCGASPLGVRLATGAARDPPLLPPQGPGHRRPAGLLQEQPVCAQLRDPRGQLRLCRRCATAASDTAASTPSPNTTRALQPKRAAAACTSGRGAGSSRVCAAFLPSR